MSAAIRANWRYVPALARLLAPERRTAGSTATGTDNHWHAQPSTALASWQGRPDVVHAGSSHRGGLAGRPFGARARRVPDRGSRGGARRSFTDNSLRPLSCKITCRRLALDELLSSRS